MLGDHNFLIKEPLNFKNECEINGHIKTYNACSKLSLEESKKYYSQFNYIGSGFITYHNGIKNTWDEEHHFFVLK